MDKIYFIFHRYPVGIGYNHFWGSIFVYDILFCTLFSSVLPKKYYLFLRRSGWGDTGVMQFLGGFFESEKFYCPAGKKVNASF